MLRATNGQQRAFMTEINKLDAAFARFESALGKFEMAVQKTAAEHSHLKAQAAQAEVITRDHVKLNEQLNLVRVKAAELVDTSKEAAGKIDTAMGRIRSVLHSNSGA